MALSSGIPTSFVPKQPVQPVRRPMQSGSNLFLLVSLIIAALVSAVAVGTFVYGRFLDRTLANKQAELSQAQSKVNESTVQEFIDLRNRLAATKELLSNHIALSHFFDSLEALTLQGVRFNDMKLTVAGDNTAQLQMSGTAKSFNALAAQSNAFAGEKRIKRAIFSDITITNTKLVSFKMTGDIDSKLILEGNTPSPAPALQAKPPVPVPPVQTTATQTAATVTPRTITP